ATVHDGTHQITIQRVGGIRERQQIEAGLVQFVALDQEGRERRKVRVQLLEIDDHRMRCTCSGKRGNRQERSFRKLSHVKNSRSCYRVMLMGGRPDVKGGCTLGSVNPSDEG